MSTNSQFIKINDKLIINKNDIRLIRVCALGRYLEIYIKPLMFDGDCEETTCIKLDYYSEGAALDELDRINKLLKNDSEEMT